MLEEKNNTQGLSERESSINSSEDQKEPQNRRWKIVLVGILLIVLIGIGATAVVTKVIIPANNYKAAVKMLETGDYENAIAAFTNLGDYKDSKEKVEEAEQARDYEKAKDLLKAEKYEEAIDIFKSLGGYKDSKSQMEKATEALLERDYSAAVDLLDAKKYEEAIEILDSLDNYKDSNELIQQAEKEIAERDYQSAVTLLKEGKYKEAAALFGPLGDYKDSLECLKLAKLKGASVGDVVQFGEYEQDNNQSNGKEPIEWKVLKQEGSRILLISLYGIDGHIYDAWGEPPYGCTWETCDVRKWLNGTFIKEAFSTEEQGMILLTSVSADKNREYEKMNPGNDTKDKIFLLSTVEAEELFHNDASRRCTSTEYAKVQIFGDNYKKEDVSEDCSWWLRTPGYDGASTSSTVAVVTETGGVGYYGSATDRANFTPKGVYVVRPALWIDIKSL